MKKARASVMVLILALSTFAGCRTVKHVVTKIDPITSGDPNTAPTLPSHGLVYALPKTRVTVEIPVTLVKRPGPFVREVRKYEGEKSSRIEEVKRIQIARLSRLSQRVNDLRDKAQNLRTQAVEVRVKAENLVGAERKAEEASKEAAEAAKKRAEEARKEAEAAEKEVTAAEMEVAEFEVMEKNAIEEAKQELRRRLYNLGIEYPEQDTPTTKEFKIGTPTIASEAVPDLGHIYLVHIKGGWLEDRALDLTLTEAGFLVSGTSEAKDRTVELAVKTIEVVASVVGRVAGLPGIMAVALEPEVDKPRHPNPYTKALKFVEAIEDVRQKMLEVKAGRGSSGMSLDTLKLMLEELKKHEKVLIAYFWTTSVTPWKARVEYQPEKGQVPIQVFDLMVNKDGEDLYLENGGENLVQPIPEAFGKPRGQPHGRIHFTISHKSVKGVADVVGGYKWPQAKELGFRYRIPAEVVIEVRKGDEVLVQKPIHVAQFGTVVVLPSDTGSTESKYSIKLFTELGALENIRIDSKGIQPSTIEGAGAAAEAVVAAVAARKEAKSEVAQLEREVKLLRLKKEKKWLEETLGLR